MGHSSDHDIIQSFIERAQRDQSVYIHEVRRAFDAHGTIPFVCHVVQFDGQVKRFALTLMPFKGEGQRGFVESYVHAMLYNILSSLGAVRIDIFTDLGNAPVADIARNLNDVFQVARPKPQRTGYGCCLNVNERIMSALSGERGGFGFAVHDVASEPAVRETPKAITARSVFTDAAATAERVVSLGMDVGGTDIKLAASVHGKLVALKEYDWFPAGFECSEQLIDPILLLTRLMRAAVSLVLMDHADAIDPAVLAKEATTEQIERAVADMEEIAGSALRGFDAIGLCFPDVVIRNKIVGGETYKTRGMRNNAALDYEEQFARITRLDELLVPYAPPGGAVMLTNDGPMAAFTAAVEQAANAQDVSRGFFAHTLGTELGTGWVKGDGTIPDIPLEVYNFIIDLGSFPQKRYDADDLRSINNFNTGLPGTLQKYPCQSGVFRLAAKLLPEAAPSVYAQAFERGLFVQKGDKLIVPTVGTDMRKPCLEYFMRAASDEAMCAEIFRIVGEYMGVTWIETEFILAPETPVRTLFGRLVKDPRCFELMNEGARRIAQDIVQCAADERMANTSLMRQLSESKEYTVAQFGQAIGAIFYGCSGLDCSV